MPTKLDGLEAIWDAAARRNKVYQLHPELEKLEKALAEAIILCTQGKITLDDTVAVREARNAFLARHGIPADYAEPRWRCAVCQDEGYINGALCSCKKQDNLNRLFTNSGLPPRLRAETFERFDLKWYSPVRKTPLGITEREVADGAHKAAMQFVATCVEGRTPRGLYVYGGVGLGKTLLLSAMCNALLQHRIPTLYMVFSDLIADIKKSFEQEHAVWSESALMAAAKQTPVLILDDLGAEQITEFVINRLFDIVNYRRNNELPLVASSNLSIPEVGAWYGDRVASRLWEVCTPIPMYGQDIRVQKTRQP